MLFLVISRPARSKITKELIQARLTFRDWIRRLKKKVKCFYPRKGRGSVVIFEVDSRKELSGLLREWSRIVRAGFDVYPLEYPKKAEAALRALLGDPGD